MQEFGPSNHQEILFPQYLEELLELKPGKAEILVEKYIQSILNRLIIPHIHEGKVCKYHFFKHLNEYAQQLANEHESEIEIDLYIGGGVVRTLLQHLYNFIYQRRNKEDQEESLPNKSTKYIDNDPLFDSEDIEVINQKKYKDQLLESSEFHITQSILAEKSPLLNAFVLGVGSDLDIYYEIHVKGRAKNAILNAKQISAGNKLREKLINYINDIEKKHDLTHVKNSSKKSFLPIADVKEYHEQIARALDQGGSLLDLLAFKIKSENTLSLRVLKETKIQLRHPDAYPHILRDFLQGKYEYIAPNDEFKSLPKQKQTIRGIRPLLEMSQVSVKDPTVLIKELTNILDDVNKGNPLNHDAIEQFDKAVRNQNFQLSKNRPYREKNSPLSIALEIARSASKFDDSLSENKKVKLLLPQFLQKLFSKSKQKKGNFYSELMQQCMQREDFIKTHTTNGMVFHGTDSQAGLCVLRGGFILSTNEQGTAVLGPGVYAGSIISIAAEYSRGMILPLKISDNPHLKIIDYSHIDNKLSQLTEEAIEKEFVSSIETDKIKITEGIYSLLRAPDQYGIDIIICTNEILLIQNQNAIELEQSVNSILNLNYYQLQLQLDLFNSAPITDESYSALENYLTAYTGFYQLISKMDEVSSTLPSPPEIFEEIFRNLEKQNYLINERMLINKNFALHFSHYLAKLQPSSQADYLEKFKQLLTALSDKNNRSVSKILKSYKTILPEGVANGLFIWHLQKNACHHLGFISSQYEKITVTKSEFLLDAIVDGLPLLSWAAQQKSISKVITSLLYLSNVDEYNDFIKLLLQHFNQLLTINDFKIILSCLIDNNYPLIVDALLEVYKEVFTQMQWNEILNMNFQTYEEKSYPPSIPLLDYVYNSLWNTDLVKILFKHGFSIHSIKHPVYSAVSDSNMELVKLFITNGANYRETDPHGEMPIAKAITRNNVEITQYLFDCGHSVDELVNIRDRKVSLFEYALVCTLSTEPEILDLFIKKGANVNGTNHKGQCYLISTLVAYKFVSAEFLLQNGVDPARKDQNGNSFLHILLNMLFQGKCKESVILRSIEILTRQGMNIDITDNFGMTPLMFAAALGLKNVVTCMLEYGANVNKQDNDGMSVLHHAIDRGAGDTAIVQQILDANPDCTLVDKKGSTAHTDAQQYNRPDLAELISSHQASLKRKSELTDENAKKRLKSSPADPSQTITAISSRRKRPRRS